MKLTRDQAVGRPRIEADEAAIEPLRWLRREPRTALVWAAVSLVVSLVMGVSMIAVSGSSFAALANAGPRPDPSVVGAALLGAAPGWLLSMVLSLVLYAFFYAAMNRVILRPGDGGWFHLRCGRDELRQGLLFALLWLLLLALYVALVVAGAILIGLVVVAGVFASGGKGGAAGAVVGIATVVVVLLSICASVAAVVWIGVRLSLASALTFDTGRVRLFGSWRLTRGVFWPLFGAYLLAFVIMALIAVVLLVLSALVALATGGGANAVMHVDMSSLGAYFTAARVVQTLISAAAFPAFLALAAGTPACAYAQIMRAGADAPGGRFGTAQAEGIGPAG